MIVTSGINARGEGFYVQDPGGGEYSGVYVYTALAGEGIAPLVGNSVSVTGVVVEYYGFTEISVSPQSVVTTGEGTVTPTVVSEVSDWEAYEGVLPTLEQQEVVSDLNDYGECQLSFGVTMDNEFYDFSTEFGATYDSVTGLVSYSFETYKLSPRNDADLQGYVAGAGPETLSISEIQQGQNSEEPAYEAELSILMV